MLKVLSLAVLVFAVSAAGRCKAADVELYLCIGAHNQEWTDRSAPPPDWRAVRAKFWVEAFFPEKSAATIIAIEPPPFLPSGVGRFFHATRDRYTKRITIKIGRVPVEFEYHSLSPAALTDADRERLLDLLTKQDKLDDSDLTKRLWKFR